MVRLIEQNEYNIDNDFEIEWIKKTASMKLVTLTDDEAYQIKDLLNELPDKENSSTPENFRLKDELNSMLPEYIQRNIRKSSRGVNIFTHCNFDETCRELNKDGWICNRKLNRVRNSGSLYASKDGFIIKIYCGEHGTYLTPINELDKKFLELSGYTSWDWMMWRNNERKRARDVHKKIRF